MKRLRSVTDMWFLFAHGAGAPSSSPWMTRYRDLLGSIAPVVSFDYDYMAQGRKRPDTLPKLIETHRRTLEEGKKEHGDSVVLVGKSMGGRVGCHLALEEAVSGLICLGYPLKGMGKTAALRDQVLLELDRPVLFVQGTRDQLCPLDLLRPVLNKRNARSELFVVETGNHSLEPTKKYLKESGRSERDLERLTLDAISTFLESLI